MKKTTCPKCEAAGARVTELLGVATDFQGRTLDLEEALVAVEKMMTDQDDRGELNEAELALLERVRVLLRASGRGVDGAFRQILENEHDQERRARDREEYARDMEPYTRPHRDGDVTP